MLVAASSGNVTGGLHAGGSGRFSRASGKMCVRSKQFRRCTLDGRASPDSALIADRLINEPGAVVSELKPLLDGPVGINSQPARAPTA